MSFVIAECSLLGSLSYAHGTVTMYKMSSRKSHFIASRTAHECIWIVQAMQCCKQHTDDICYWQGWKNNSCVWKKLFVFFHISTF